jgi:hypothetical protein
MPTQLAALVRYVDILGASAAGTTRAEDRSVYQAHLAEAALMVADLHAGRVDALRTRLKSEEHAYGWSFLSGEHGAQAEAAFTDLVRQLGDRSDE